MRSSIEGSNSTGTGSEGLPIAGKHFDNTPKQVQCQTPEQLAISLLSILTPLKHFLYYCCYFLILIIVVHSRLFPVVGSNGQGQIRNASSFRSCHPSDTGILYRPSAFPMNNPTNKLLTDLISIILFLSLRGTQYLKFCCLKNNCTDVSCKGVAVAMTKSTMGTRSVVYRRKLRQIGYWRVVLSKQSDRLEVDVFIEPHTRRTTSSSDSCRMNWQEQKRFEVP